MALQVADLGNNKIRRVTQAGVVTTFAGSVLGYMNGSPYMARFNDPYGICMDPQGNLYVADIHNFAIRKITFE